MSLSLSLSLSLFRVLVFTPSLPNLTPPPLASATTSPPLLQIGDLAKGAGLAAQNSILYRARLLLRSKSWDTRVAAAAAVEAVCRNMEAWAPRVDGAAGEIKMEEEGGGSVAAGVLDTFDVETIIAKGQLLVSSSGAEFNDIDMDPQERLALQKQQLRETLGLAPAKGGSDGKKPPTSSMPTHKGDLFNVGDMIDDKDLVGGSGQNEEEERKRKLKRKASDLVESMAPQVPIYPPPSLLPHLHRPHHQNPTKTGSLKRKASCRSKEKEQGKGETARS
jgi:hypothetical protein